MKKSLGIYKIPPLWDRKTLIETKYIDYENINNIDNINEHKTRKTSIFDNIYFNLYQKIVNNNNYDENNYIFIDEYILKNIKFTINNINIYILKDYESLCYFKDADFYFLRGCYFNFYNQIIKEKSKVLFYPAVSLQYNYYDYNNKIIKSNTPFKLREIIKELKFNVEHDFLKKIDICLIHENKYYNYIFKNSKNIIFNKFSSIHFYNLNLERIYDYIFVADSTQYTKNHELLFYFIKYCENKKIKIKILYISNVLDLYNKYKNYFINPSNLNYVILEYYYNLTPKELNILFNQTKINLILSNRDACPRIISESLASGCYNVSLDLLSDGKNYFYENDLFGSIINLEEHLNVKISKSNSLTYIYEDILSEKILEFNNNKYNHKLISEKSLENYNINNLYKNIIKYL